MKSITIHNLENDLEERVSELSKKWNLSLNKTIKKLLRQTLGLEGESIDIHRFDHLAGTWNDEESKEFEERMEIFNVIDPEVWQ